MQAWNQGWHAALQHARREADQEVAAVRASTIKASREEQAVLVEALDKAQREVEQADHKSSSHPTNRFNHSLFDAPLTV